MNSQTNTASHAAFERTVHGLGVAAKLCTKEEDAILAWFIGLKVGDFDEKSDPRTVSRWLALAEELLADDSDLLLLVNLIIGLAYMRERSQKTTLSEDNSSISFIWPLIHQALTPASSPFTVSRSAGGFLFVPLCSLIVDGNIDELWRLHVWLPGGKRGNEYFGVQGHTAFGQSWILSGEGTNRRWDEPAVGRDAGGGSGNRDPRRVRGRVGRRPRQHQARRCRRL
jgi:hypothetical protein